MRTVSYAAVGTPASRMASLANAFEPSSRAAAALGPNTATPSAASASARPTTSGASVKAQWATLGRYDFVNVVEAPDEQTMARVSLELGSRGTTRFETMAAIPIDDFISSL